MSIGDQFGIRFIPNSIRGFFLLENPASPYATVFAVQEKSLQGQYGFEWMNINWGFRLTAVEFKYQKNEFFLLELSDSPDLLKSKNSKQLLLDFGTLYLTNFLWDMTLAFQVKSIPISYSDEGTEAEPITDYQFGVSFRLPIRLIDFRINIDNKSMTFTEGWDERWHISTSIGYGAMSVVTGLDIYGASGGLYMNVESLKAALIYATTVNPFFESDVFSQTMYAQFGWKF